MAESEPKEKHILPEEFVDGFSTHEILVIPTLTMARELHLSGVAVSSSNLQAILDKFTSEVNSQDGVRIITIFNAPVPYRTRGDETTDAVALYGLVEKTPKPTDHF